MGADLDARDQLFSFTLPTDLSITAADKSRFGDFTKGQLQHLIITERLRVVTDIHASAEITGQTYLSKSLEMLEPSTTWLNDYLSHTQGGKNTAAQTKQKLLPRKRKSIAEIGRTHSIKSISSISSGGSASSVSTDGSGDSTRHLSGGALQRSASITYWQSDNAAMAAGKTLICRIKSLYRSLKSVAALDGKGAEQFALMLCVFFRQFNPLPFPKEQAFEAEISMDGFKTTMLKMKMSDTENWDEMALENLFNFMDGYNTNAIGNTLPDCDGMLVFKEVSELLSDLEFQTEDEVVAKRSKRSSAVSAPPVVDEW